MLSFKEFVFEIWKLRGHPVGLDAEESWPMWAEPNENNGWWRRYEGWVSLQCPMPLEDTPYDKLYGASPTYEVKIEPKKPLRYLNRV
jgi:hypothetical protein